MRGRALFSVLLLAGAALAAEPQPASVPVEDEDALWRVARGETI